MIGAVTRALVRKAPAARLQMALVHRSMATESMELPKASSAVWLVGGAGALMAVEAWVYFNDLIVWGLAPERPKAESIASFSVKE